MRLISESEIFQNKLLAESSVQSCNISLLSSLSFFLSCDIICILIKLAKYLAEQKTLFVNAIMFLV